MFFFHGEHSSPEEFVPVALAWQLKFPGATVLVMQGPQPQGDHYHWYDARGTTTEVRSRLSEAAAMVAARLLDTQHLQGISPAKTMLVGFSQGANLVFELIRQHPDLCSLAVIYAGRLARPMQTGERLGCDVHLIHGGLDSRVPLVYARQAFDGLNAIGAQCSLDVIEEASHHIDQDMIILGTTRALQTVFAQRKRQRIKTLN
jgi:phospholipase/carboxylesterase